MRYIIIGAGAIGGAVGGLLADAGSEVVLVARGAHGAAMGEHGVLVRLPDTVVRSRPPVIEHPGEVQLRQDDVLVLSTKTQQAVAALATWADAPVADSTGNVVGTAGERLPLLTALNGIASEAMALRWFARVFAVCVWMPAVMAAPGELVVRCDRPHGQFHMSRYPARVGGLDSSDDAVLLAALAAQWASAGLMVPLPVDAMPWKNRKLIGNLGNAVQALLGEQEAGQDIVAAARQEALALYTAAGIEMNSEDDEHRFREQLVVRPVPGAPTRMGGSTWQSLARGTGSVETDYLNGEIVALAHRLGRRAPVNATLARLLRQAAACSTKPGEVSEAELRAAVGLGPRTASVS